MPRPLPHMQHVTAFSRPQTVPAVPTTVPQRNPWILNRWRDLLFYVGTPLLLIPMFALAQARWSAQDIYLFVAAFGAMGHHLPGMIRAYGDRALFERFRWRFILAPIFLLGVCVFFYFSDAKANPVILIVFLWGVWHGMMQTYGFCRIYDAKMASFAAINRRLDFATCGIWFAAAVLLSPQRMTDTLDAFYESGGPFIAPGTLHVLQQTVWFAAIGVSILFLANFVRMWVQGQRQSPVKLALLVTSISFWWYCNNGVTNILAGIALFEVFHDTQYLSLVWIYNRNRVEKDNSIGGFMRFVFRRSGSLIGLYVGLVFAYGSIGYFTSHLSMETVKNVLTGVVAASGLLHFYYDGFIWKVREKSTRESLGLTGGGADVKLGGLIPGWALHGGKWAVAFVLPLSAMWVGQTFSKVPEVDRMSWVVDDLPNSARARFNYGSSLQKEGRIDEAGEQFQAALKLDPKYTKVHVGLGNVLIARNKFDEAQGHFEDAVKLEPRDGELLSAYAYLLERMGKNDEAAEQYQAAIKFSPKSARLLYTYAAFLDKNGRGDEAIAQWERALKIDPNLADAHSDLGTALLVKGDVNNAKTHYEAAAKLQPKRSDVHVNLGNVFAVQGKMTQAILEYEEALRLDPNSRPAAESLRMAKAREGRFRSHP